MQTKSTVTAGQARGGHPPEAVPRSRADLTLKRLILAVIVPVLLPGLPAQAQQPANDPQTSWSLSATTAQQFGADLDGGGDVEASRVLLNASAARRIDSRFEAGMNLSYQFDDWEFGNPAAFGNVAPWGDIHRAGIGLRLGYAGENGWHYALACIIHETCEQVSEWRDCEAASG